MYWSFELESYFDDAPWPATKEELIDYLLRSGAPPDLVANMDEELPDNPTRRYTDMDDIWPERPKKEEFYNDEEEDL